MIILTILHLLYRCFIPTDAFWTSLDSVLGAVVAAYTLYQGVTIMMNARADLRDLRDDRIHRSLDMHHQQQYSSGLVMSHAGKDDGHLSIPLSSGSSFRSHGYTNNQSFVGITPTKRVRFEDDSTDLTSPFMSDSPSVDNGLDTRAIQVERSYDSASDEESHPAVVSS